VSAASQLDETLRAIVRDVVRDEIRAAFQERSAVDARRNVGRDAGSGYLSISRAAAFADVAPGTLPALDPIGSPARSARRPGLPHRAGRAGGVPGQRRPRRRRHRAGPRDRRGRRLTHRLQRFIGPASLIAPVPAA
jgi:hypothetical protein